MELETEVVDGATVVRPRGRLDMVAAPQLRTALDDVIAGGAGLVVVVDFSATDFVDSSGLGAVVGGLRAARQAGGDLRIACVGGQVATVLGLTTLDRVFRAHATVEDAIGAGS
jgi:anti-sigma B factor antagonist